MSIFAAKAVIIGIAALGALFWLLALRKYLRLLALPARIERSRTFPSKSPEQAMRAALGLATTQNFRVVERSERRLVLEVPLPRRPKIIVDVRTETGGTSVHLEADISPSRRLFGGIAVALLAFGLLVLVGLPLVLWFLAAESENPVLRWQAVQAIHVGHFIWPPFLLIYLCRKISETAETLLENLLIAIEVSE